MSADSRRNIETFVGIAYSARFSQRTSESSCSGYFGEFSADFGNDGTPKARATGRVELSGSHAAVTFPSGWAFLDGPNGDQVDLVNVDGHWRVNYSDDANRLSDIRIIDAKPAAIQAWNTALANGEVTFTPPVYGLASREIWASLYGTTMSIDTPSVSLSYTRNDTGLWAAYPAADAPTPGTLSRNVWLTSNGEASPASAASPDGAVPALGGGSVPQQTATTQHTTEGSTTNPSTSTPTHTTTQGLTTTAAATGGETTAAPAVGQRCGTVTGGAFDYRGQTLTVHATSGVS